MNAPGRLAAACLLALAWAAPLQAAEVHLRGHWLQVIDDEDSLVGVLSRDEAGAAVAVELYLEAYRDGVAIGEAVHRFRLEETVRLFAIPLEAGVDCYRVLGLVGLDAEDGPLSATDDSPPGREACPASELLTVSVDGSGRRRIF
ncbi:hypothetical protein [Pseudomonas sp. Q1-7]|uniref:hypothetical protein n=1 Tax=Pseudomonas sp. Q1-7 TaxID=3020843 RepID=UPI002300B188|nr:hypothetical protein [Pseudomonas sp. Q1-7]